MRPRGSPAPAGRRERAKRPTARAIAAAGLPPSAKQARAAPDRVEISEPEPEPGDEMRRQARGHRSGPERVEQPRAHALCIHFQADQQPSASPSISNGAVQNIPDAERPVEPAADDNADQHRDDDDPAEHADLRQAPRRRTVRPRCSQLRWRLPRRRTLLSNGSSSSGSVMRTCPRRHDGPAADAS